VGSNMDKIFIVMDYVEHDLKSLMETMKQKKQVFIPGDSLLFFVIINAMLNLNVLCVLHQNLSVRKECCSDMCVCVCVYTLM